MSSNLILKLGELIERRQFLKRASYVVGAFMAGVLGIPKAGAAVTVKCCQLCHESTGFSGCSCVWGWVCPDYEETCYYYSCEECFETCDPCDDYQDKQVECRPNMCTDVIASRHLQLSKIPGCTPP